MKKDTKQSKDKTSKLEEQKEYLEIASADIEVAKLYQRENQWLEKSRRYIGYIDGIYPPGLDTPYVVNTFYTLINLIIPSLYYQDPVISVNSHKDDVIITNPDGITEHYPTALICSLRSDILNALYPSLNIGDELRKGIQNALIYGWGVFKTGITTKSESSAPFSLPKKSIYVTSLCPEDVLYDPMATGSFDNCAFIAHRYTKETRLLQDDKSLKNTKNLEGHTIEQDTPKGDLYKAVQHHTQRKYTTLYEYHEQSENNIATIAQEDATSTHPVQPANLLKLVTNNSKTSAFTLLRFSTLNDRLRGISTLGTQEDEALAINQVLTAQIRHINIFGGVLVYEKGALTEQQLEAWRMSRQGDMLEVEANALAGPSGARVRREAPLQMGADYFNSIQSFSGLIDRGLGVYDFQSMNSTKRKTATESAFEQGTGRVRRDYLLSFVKQAVLDISQKVLELADKYYTHKEIVELIGYDFPKELWTALPKNNLFSLDLDIESMVVFDQSMATGLMQATQFLMSNPLTQPTAARLDGEKISKKIFKGFGANIEYFYKDSDFIHNEASALDENEAFLNGQVVPSPQPFDDHQGHITTHQRSFVEAQSKEDEDTAQRIMEHMQLHAFFAQASQAMQGGSPMNAQGQGGNVPLNNPGQEQAPDQAEVQGNFRRPT